MVAENLEKILDRTGVHRVYLGKLGGVYLPIIDFRLEGGCTMAMSQTANYQRNDLSQLDYTYDLLSSLTDDELRAVQQVATVFINRKHDEIESDVIVPFKPQTEEQLFKRIDRSLKQVDAGLCEDLDDVVAEMLSGIEA